MQTRNKKSSKFHGVLVSRTYIIPFCAVHDAKKLRNAFAVFVLFVQIKNSLRIYDICNLCIDRLIRDQSSA